jgi:hypothetical protein
MPRSATTDSQAIEEEEEEGARLSTLLHERCPVPCSLSPKEQWAITRAIKDDPALTKIHQGGIERFFGTTTTLSDGRLLLVFLGRPDLPLGSPLSFLVWGSVFGGCLRAMLRVSTRLKQVVLIPEEAEFEALCGGVVVIAYWRMNKLEAAFEIDYRQPVLADALARICQIARENHAALLQYPNVIWDRERLIAHSVGEAFTNQFGRLEWLQLGWIKESQWRIPHLLAMMPKLLELAERASKWELLRHYPAIREAIETARTLGSDQARLSRLLNMFANRTIAPQFMMEVIVLNEQHCEPDEDAKFAVGGAINSLFPIWHVRALGPKASKWGRVQEYFDGGQKTVETYPIDYAGFAIERDQDAENYWQHLKPHTLFDAPSYLDPWDMPTDPKAVFDAWEKEALEIEPTSAAQTVKNLIDEANALRRWTIPPRAHVDIRVGPFVGVELTEIADEVYFVWRTHDARYWLTSVGTRRQTFDNDMLGDPQTHGPRTQAAMRLLMAALIRDFWVVEERRAIFDIQHRRAPREGTQRRSRPQITYLPRVQYITGGLRLGQLSDGLQHSARARHYVRPFFRKAETPSALQIEIAKRHRISLPPGHTYVRGHYRGGGEDQRVYRSRSALSLLYGVVSPPRLNSTGPLAEDWFAFEQAIATLLENQLGFAVLHRAVRGRGDQGIDILATKAIQGRTDLWVVQCKHYSASNPIGPGVVRELLGAMGAVGHDDGQVVRGMLVTSGRITGDALKLAAAQGVQTYNGEQLLEIYAAVNRQAAAG